jgi:hypothetical protein
MRSWVLIFLFLCYNLRAQDPKSVFSLKPSLGLNACQVHGDSYSGYRKPGIFGGMAVNAAFNQKVSLELGFYFSQKGASRNPTKDDHSHYRLNLNYIDMPLSLRCHLNPRYFITLGPSIAYLISYREIIDYIDFTGMYTFKKYEAGLNIGMGRTMGKNLSVEVRCSNSITSVRDYGIVSNVFYPNPVARFFNKGFYNNLLTFMLTYTFEQSKRTRGEPKGT